VAVRPVLSGVCGSDWSLIQGLSSPYLAPLTSFPAVLGHEIVGELDSDTGPWPRGTPVVVDPSLTCAGFGEALCRACAAGQPDGCERRMADNHGPGLLMGYTARFPGGWSTRLWAPFAQLHQVPADMELRRAVLTEPTTIVLNGLSRVNWQTVDTALIIGGGPMGLLAGLAMAERHPSVRLTMAVRYGPQADVAAALSNGAILLPREVERVEGIGPRRAGLWGAPATLAWGFDLVVDAVGTEASVQQALTVTRPGGQVLLVGGAGLLRVDWTPAWSRNLTVFGTYGYGPEPAARFADALLLLYGTKRPVARIVGAERPLSDYRAAMTDFWRDRHRLIKLAFTPP
jgi:threonine dehydrogenase-like Zn-dependent dehydrogenase